MEAAQPLLSREELTVLTLCLGIDAPIGAVVWAAKRGRQ